MSNYSDNDNYKIIDGILRELSVITKSVKMNILPFSNDLMEYKCSSKFYNSLELRKGLAIFFDSYKGAEEYLDMLKYLYSKD